MVAQYTTNLRLTQQGTGDNPNTWGTVFNQQVIALLEESIAGVADVDITGSSNVTLTTETGSTDQARNAVLELTGTVGDDIDLLVPSVDKVYLLRGGWTGDYTVTVKISGSSTSVDMSTGDVKIVYTNGVDIYDMVDVDVTGFLAIADNLSDLASASTARDNLGLGELATQDETDFLATIYPVGSIYINATDGTNPNTLFGFGTWVAFGAGRVPVGIDSSDSDFDTAEETGGAKEITLSTSQVPNLSFSIAFNGASDTSTSGGTFRINGFGTGSSTYNGSTSGGGGGAHDNVQPYIVVYMWKRTA